MARRRSYRERSRNYELAISARHPPLSASMRSSRPVTVEVLAREVAAARFRPFQSPPLEVVLPPVDQRFEDGDPRVVLAVGRYQVPVRVRIIGHRDHVLQGVQVGTALLSVAPVIGGEFPLTPDDWRNREKRGAYLNALEDMVAMTDNSHAHWDLI